MTPGQRQVLLLCVVLALGGFVRFVGLTRGSSDFHPSGNSGQTSFYDFHPDERTLIGAAVELESPFEPPLTSYGMLPMGLLRGALEVASRLGNWDLSAFDTPTTAASVFAVSRGLSAALSCMALLFVWLLGRQLTTPGAAILATLFVATAPLAIQQAHFYTVDGLFTVLSLAMFWAQFRALQAGQRRWYVLTGLLIGAAGAVRLNGLLLGIVFIAGHIFSEWQAGTGWPGLRQCVRRLTRRPRLVAATTAATFLALQPFVLLNPGLLLRDHSHQDLGYSVAAARGDVLHPWTLADVHTIPYLHHWIDLWPSAVGWPLTCAFALAAGAVLLRPGLYPRLILLWCVINFALIGGLHTKHVRYLLPMLPLMAILAADLCSRWWQPERGVRWRRIGICLTAALTIWGCAYGFAFASIYQREDSRITAARWVADHVPVGATVGLEGGISLRNLVDPAHYQLWEINALYLFYTGPYLLCMDRVQYLRERLRQLEYVAVVDVNRYRQFAAVPELFPVAAQFYTRLMASQLGFEVVHRSKSYPSLLGVEFRDDDAEPSFLAYDHPAAFVLKRNSMADVDAAFATWQRDIETDECCPDRSLQSAADFMRAGDLPQAARIVRQVQDRMPLPKVAHRLEAEIHRLGGETGLEARAMSRYGLYDRQKFAAHLRNPATVQRIPGATATTFAEIGLHDLALRVLQDAARRDVPVTAGSRHDMANSYITVASRFVAKGQLSHAQQALELSIAIFARPAALNALAHIALGAGEYDLARDYWLESVQRDSTQVDVYAELARLRERSTTAPGP